MRLAKREVTDPDDLRGIVGQCRTLRLGLCDADGPFVVPVSFGTEWAGDDGQSNDAGRSNDAGQSNGDGRSGDTGRSGDDSQSIGGGCGLTLWIHSSREGRKADALRSGGPVAIEMDRELGVYSGEFSCAWSMAYESIMGTARVHEAQAREEKLHGLERLMAHMAPGEPCRFDGAAVDHTAVFALEVQELTGKRREAS